jgi:hypothetical protein
LRVSRGVLQEMWDEIAAKPAEFQGTGLAHPGIA